MGLTAKEDVNYINIAKTGQIRNQIPHFSKFFVS